MSGCFRAFFAISSHWEDTCLAVRRLTRSSCRLFFTFSHRWIISQRGYHRSFQRALDHLVRQCLCSPHLSLLRLKLSTLTVAHSMRNPRTAIKTRDQIWHSSKRYDLSDIQARNSLSASKCHSDIQLRQSLGGLLGLSPQSLNLCLVSQLFWFFTRWNARYLSKSDSR